MPTDSTSRQTGTNAAYGYNGAGLRTARTIAGATVSYTWDLTGSLPNILEDSSGNKYVYGLDLISRTDSGGAQEYYLYDGLGSTTGIANGSATVTDTFSYDVYGAVRTRTGSSTNEFSYTGEQNDATGLEYLRARYYDKASGRFIGRDPLPLMQRYAYANGNPGNLTDPSGLSPVDPILAAARAILADKCWLTHAFCPNPPFNWKDVRRRTRDTGDWVGKVSYPVYYGAYQAQRGVEKLPSTPLTDPIRRTLCVLQLAGLAGNTLGDAIEKYPGGKNEALFDDHRVKNTAPFNILPFLDDREFLPGIGHDTEGWHVDIKC